MEGAAWRNRLLHSTANACCLPEAQSNLASTVGIHARLFSKGKRNDVHCGARLRAYDDLGHVYDDFNTDARIRLVDFIRGYVILGKGKPKNNPGTRAVERQKSGVSSGWHVTFPHNASLLADKLQLWFAPI